MLKDHTVDAKIDPLGLIVLMKMYEVQTYLSLTNHWWSGFTLVANAHVWRPCRPIFKRRQQAREEGSRCTTAGRRSARQ